MCRRTRYPMFANMLMSYKSMIPNMQYTLFLHKNQHLRFFARILSIQVYYRKCISQKILIIHSTHQAFLCCKMLTFPSINNIARDPHAFRLREKSHKQFASTFPLPFEETEFLTQCSAISNATARELAVRTLKSAGSPASSSSA